MIYPCNDIHRINHFSLPVRTSSQLPRKVDSEGLTAVDFALACGFKLSDLVLSDNQDDTLTKNDDDSRDTTPAMDGGFSTISSQNTVGDRPRSILDFDWSHPSNPPKRTYSICSSVSPNSPTNSFISMLKVSSITSPPFRPPCSPTPSPTLHIVTSVPTHVLDHCPPSSPTSMMALKLNRPRPVKVVKGRFEVVSSPREASFVTSTSPEHIN